MRNFYRTNIFFDSKREMHWIKLDDFKLKAVEYWKIAPGGCKYIQK